MPVQYEGLKAEHEAVRTRCGMFDVSHMGEFLVVGPDALALIQWISSNDAAKLVDHGVVHAGASNRRPLRRLRATPRPLEVGLGLL